MRWGKWKAVRPKPGVGWESYDLEADAGEILVSPATARALPASYLGARKGGGTLLRRVAPMPS